MTPHTSNYSEKELEDHVCQAMQQVGYHLGNPADFDKRYAIDTTEFWQFLHTSQQDELDELIKYNPNDWQEKILSRLDRTLKKDGIISVLKKGIGVDGVWLRLLYPAPLASSSDSVREDYQLNRFSITRQVHYSQAEPMKSVDMVLFINGLAIATFELKSTYKSQTARFEALNQYKQDRDQKETLFNFARCVVHFALDNKEAYMTTRLNGDSTYFLPFNKGSGTGNGGGSGNPPKPTGFATAYIWEEVLTPDSLVNLLSHFVRLGSPDPEDDQRKKSTLNEQVLFFPRYHQMNVVRKLVADVAKNGVGKRYLIQHSAGSGKSNSMTWLAFGLIEVYPELGNTTANNGLTQGQANQLILDKPLIDTVIVVTDRRLLDKQIKNNIKQFSEVKGIVAHAHKSKDLRHALEEGKKIVITTIQKFPYVLDDISDMADKHFAIIIDEAHSSQSGTAHDSMNHAIGVEDTDADSSDLDNPDLDTTDAQDKIIEAIESRKMRGNASYFAFTATPKDSTLEKFGVKQSDGSFAPFDLYSMKQAIQEGFILDVLSNYTTFKSYYQLQKTIDDDPAFDAVTAQKALKAKVERDKQTIAVKADIIAEHFVQNVYAKKRLKGHAKGMVVTQNIETAIRYYHALTKSLEAMGNPFKILIAFSGEKQVDGITYTEAQMNGVEESKTKETFDTDDYRLLVVANKYLTGFDQPKLTAMYVDKKLKDVLAVQTLSRLNRSSPKLGKTTQDLFVLDFFNDIQSIRASFQKYYTATSLSEASDINVLHDIKTNLDEVGVYEPDEVDEYATLFFSGEDLATLDGKLQVFAERFNDTLELSDDEKVEFKIGAKQFVKLYSRLASIIPFNRAEWEKLYQLLKPLIPMLEVKTKESEALNELLDSVNLDTYAIERTALAQTIKLDDEGVVIDPTNPNPYSNHNPEPEMNTLDQIVEQFNDRWYKGWEATPEEKRFKLTSFAEQVAKHPDFQHKYAETTDEAHRSIEFANMVKEIIVKDKRNQIDFYRLFVEDEAFRTALISGVRQVVDGKLEHSIVDSTRTQTYDKIYPTII